MQPQQCARFLAPIVVLAVAWAVLFTTTAPAPATPEELAETAIAQIKAGQPTRGLGKISEALAKDPRNYRANFVASAYYVQTKQYDKAAPYMKTALELRQDDPELMFMIGVVCQSQQRYADAAAWYQRARAKAPTDAKIAYNLGMLYVVVLDYPKARSQFEEYLRLSPQAPDLDYVKGKIQEINQRIGAKHE